MTNEMSTPGLKSNPLSQSPQKPEKRAAPDIASGAAGITAR